MAQQGIFLEDEGQGGTAGIIWKPCWIGSANRNPLCPTQHFSYCSGEYSWLEYEALWIVAKSLEL